MQLSNEDRARLREFIASRFNLSEMKTLCFDLGVAYEEFPHATIPEFSRELIAYFERHNKVGCLIAEVLQERPDEWLTQLLARVAACRPNQKVQVVLANDKIKSRPDLKQKLAELLGISTDEVMIIATAPGSVRVLVGLPPEAAHKLAALSLPYQLATYQIVSVTPYRTLPPATRAGWKSAVTTTTASAAVGGAGGLALALKLLAVVLVGATLIVAAVLIWGNRQPELTVRNQCDTPLVIPAPDAVKSLLSLPDALPPGEALTVPVLTGEGTYTLAVENDIVVLRLPRPIPGIGLQEVVWGRIDSATTITLDGRLIRPPDSFQVESGQHYELVLCAQP